MFYVNLCVSQFPYQSRLNFSTKRNVVLDLDNLKKETTNAHEKNIIVLMRKRAKWDLFG